MGSLVPDTVPEHDEWLITICWMNHWGNEGRKGEQKIININYIQHVQTKGPPMVVFFFGKNQWYSLAPLLFSSQGIIVLALTFESFDHCWVIMWDKKSTSFFCMWLSSCLSTICWRDCVFHIELSCHSCWKLIDYIPKGLFLGYFTGLKCLSMCKSHTILIPIALL